MFETDDEVATETVAEPKAAADMVAAKPAAKKTKKSSKPKTVAASKPKTGSKSKPSKKAAASKSKPPKSSKAATKSTAKPSAAKPKPKAAAPKPKSGNGNGDEAGAGIGDSDSPKRKPQTFAQKSAWALKSGFAQTIIWMPVKLKERVRKVSAKKEVTMSEFMRTAIERSVVQAKG